MEKRIDKKIYAIGRFFYLTVKNSDEKNDIADNFPAPTINYIYKYRLILAIHIYLRIISNIKNHDWI